MVDAVRRSTLPNLRTNVVPLVVEWLGQSRDTALKVRPGTAADPAGTHSIYSQAREAMTTG
jgi:hypothetical protein